MFTAKQFINHWIRTGRDPDGNTINEMQFGDSEDNYKNYVMKKMQEFELQYKSQEYQQKKWVWHAEKDACPACQANDGRVYEEEPEPAHPNCNCEFEEIDDEEADELTQERKDKQQESLDYLNNRADKLKEQGHLYGNKECGQAVREAAEKATGKKIQKEESAKNLGKPLEKVGYQKADRETYQRDPRDIKIIQPIEGQNQNGHAQMWNGEQWVSDYKQGDTGKGKQDQGEWPNDAYRNAAKEGKVDYDYYKAPK